ncbi:MAG: DUF3147 family protein [Patescibacteria group bacterium]
MSLFYLQLLVSFIVGGGFIALLTFLAERMPTRIAGAIISMPSIVIFSYLFVGWTTSADRVGQIAFSTLAGAGAVQIFTIAYMYMSLVKVKNKFLSIFLSTISAFSAWFILAVVIVTNKISYFPLAFGIYLSCVAISYYFLHVKNTVPLPEKIHHYTTRQIIYRSTFAGLMIAFTVFLSKAVNPFWAGVFGAFPAGYSSAFIILHYYYGSPMLFKVAKNISIGSFCFASYLIASHWTFPAFGVIGGTAVSFIVSLIVLWLIEYGTKSKTI